MDNTTRLLPTDLWNNVTMTSSPPGSGDLTLYLANIRDLALKVTHDLALKVIYIIIGTVGVIDNLFVLIVFILFIKITDKVRGPISHLRSPRQRQKHMTY